VRDHDLAEMLAPLEMPIRRLGLSERDCPADHGVKLVHGNGLVHRLEIVEAPDAD